MCIFMFVPQESNLGGTKNRIWGTLLSIPKNGPNYYTTKKEKQQQEAAYRLLDTVIEKKFSCYLNIKGALMTYAEMGCGS